MEQRKIGHDLMEEADARSLVRLVGGAAGLRGNALARKRHLVRGLCRLIGAKLTKGNPSARRLAKPSSALLTNPLGGSAGLIPLIDQPAGTIPERGAPAANPQTPPALTIDGFITVYNATVGESDNIFICLENLKNTRSFTERELRLVQIILTEVPWLRAEQSPPTAFNSSATLPTRQRETLTLLLQGQSRKEIADGLGVSINTVGSYVKALYKHFQVKSQCELMRGWYKAIIFILSTQLCPELADYGDPFA